MIHRHHNVMQRHHEKKDLHNMTIVLDAGMISLYCAEWLGWYPLGP